MQPKSKLASSLIFAATILCFFFPFVTVSCGGQKVMTFTGVQLATGTSINEPQVFGQARTRKVDPNPWAALAGACAIGGLLFSLARLRIAVASAVSGALGAVSLLLMKAGMDNDAGKRGNGILQLNYETGFTLAIILLVAGAAWNAYLFSRREKTAITSQPAASEPPPVREKPG